MAELSDNGTCQSSNAFLEDERCNLQNLIFKYDQAISAVLTGGHSQYSIDTGQSSQQVTRFNLTTIQASREVLISELATLDARLGYSKATKQIVPGF